MYASMHVVTTSGLRYLHNSRKPVRNFAAAPSLATRSASYRRPWRTDQRFTGSKGIWSWAQRKQLAPSAALLTDEQLQTAKAITSTQLYSVWLQGAVVVVILGLIDAGYSGDWSRIGVLTPQAEELIRSFVGALGFFHIACAGIAAYVAASKELNVAAAVAKVSAVGFLALVEVLLKDPQKDL
eukprot:jgi/Botrbrau1/15363/Bobra.0304s0005.2